MIELPDTYTYFYNQGHGNFLQVRQSVLEALASGPSTPTSSTMRTSTNDSTVAATSSPTTTMSTTSTALTDTTATVASGGAVLVGSKNAAAASTRQSPPSAKAMIAPAGPATRNVSTPFVMASSPLRRQIPAVPVTTPAARTRGSSYTSVRPPPLQVPLLWEWNPAMMIPPPRLPQSPSNQLHPHHHHHREQSRLVSLKGHAVPSPTASQRELSQNDTPRPPALRQRNSNTPVDKENMKPTLMANKNSNPGNDQLGKLEKNRISAQQCRKRKKDRIAHLEAAYLDARHHNEELVRHLQRLASAGIQSKHSAVLIARHQLQPGQLHPPAGEPLTTRRKARRPA